MKPFKKYLCFLLIFALSALCLPALADDDLPRLTVSDSSIQDDGVVRVYLRSLSSPSTLTLTLDGEYTAGHTGEYRFERGTQLALSVSGSTIYMSVGGLIMAVGGSITFTRSSTDEGENNGIIIKETERENLYPGDLYITLNDDGGMRPVLHLNVEDYLLGVIAYEMSDSWPLEALKAQAVAARTYVMQRKGSAGGNDYDVVDTTADQVFKGVNPEYTTVAQAVADTEGIVGRYNGAYPTCYYTASNGGETSLVSDVWQLEGDWNYLDRRADPYDLENPYSVVKSVTFSPDCCESVTMKDILQDKLDALEREDAPRFDSIVSIELTDPVAEGSIMYRKLNVTVKVTSLTDAYSAPEGDTTYVPAQTASAAANSALRGLVYLERLLSSTPFTASEAYSAQDETVTLQLDVYADIKAGLDLGINSRDYEIISVMQGDDGTYTVALRRFGHGVGMSQRGAQTMAGQHGLDYLQILAFYYPGITLEKVTWNTPELPETQALPAGVQTMVVEPTPTPTPAPLPELKEGEYYAYVRLENAADALNVRKQPSTASTILDRFEEGRQVIVCSDEDENGWVAIRTAELEGFVKKEYLSEE